MSALTRVRAIVPAAAVVDLLAQVGEFGGGCRETDLGDGRVALDFWSDDPQAEVELERLVGPAGVDVEFSSRPEESPWESAMRAFHRPVVVGGRLRVRPPWHAAEPRLTDVVVDPGLAFGTGQHATTRMCLSLLVDRPPGSLVDVGCGSGVLALAALRLGHEPVRAVDHDPHSVAASAANAAANGLVLDVVRGSLHDEPLPAADGVVANLTFSLMAPLARALGAVPRWMILSGLRPFEAGEAAAIFAPVGMEVEQRRGEDGWSALLLVRPGT